MVMMKSERLKKGLETMPHRSLLRASGLKDEDFKKPFIGIANSYNDIVPGHIHLRELAKEVKRGIRDAGGVPLEWGVPGVCDGIAMHVEMRLSLPSREHIADNVEIMALSHSLDGWVGVTNCDKITPGMLMATGRLDIPAIILTGGPMMPGKIKGKKYDLISAFEAVGEVKSGKKMSEKELMALECGACPGAGSCAGLFTANSMACMTEVLGLSLSGYAATPAVSQGKRKQAYETGRKIVELVKNDVTPRKIVTRNSFMNAVMVDMAIGGSTNTALHLPAIAKEYSIDLGIEIFDKLSRKTPNICRISPSGSHYMEDLDRAGGIPAVLNRLQGMLREANTVDGKSVKDIAKEAKVRDDEVIRPIERPYSKEGGIAVLKGNLAESSVIKQSAVSMDMMTHSGPARVFHTEEGVLKAVEGGKIKEGDVIVISFMGLRGAPGMPEMLTPTSVIMGAGYKNVALITDGRFSGGTRGPCIGHVEPEAYDKGPIAAVRDGDIIDIDITGRRLNVRLSDDAIKQRLKNIKIPERDMSPLLRKVREAK
jgi:dihydroxy-acid dehydratase